MCSRREDRLEAYCGFLDLSFSSMESGEENPEGQPMRASCKWGMESSLEKIKNLLELVLPPVPRRLSEPCRGPWRCPEDSRAGPLSLVLPSLAPAAFLNLPPNVPLQKSF